MSEAPIDSTDKQQQQQIVAEASAPPAADSNHDNSEKGSSPPPPYSAVANCSVQLTTLSESAADYQAILDAKPNYDPLQRQQKHISRANHPERLALCVDASPEFAVKTFRMRNGDAVSLLDLTLKCFHLLAQNKLRLGGKHQVSLLGMRNNRITVLEPFTNDPVKIARTTASHELRDLLQKPAGDESAFSLDCLLEYAHGQLSPNQFPLDDDSDFSHQQSSLLRIVLLCCRSKHPPHLSERLLKPLLTESQLFFDILYVHEPPAPENCAEEIFKRLCCLESEHSRSYIHEVLNNPTAFFNQAASFLAHPLQRPPQSSANYRLQRPPPQESVASLPPTVLSQPEIAD